MLSSVSTGGRNAVVRRAGRCAAVQTPVNCHCQLEKHLVWDVEPVKFVMQYLTLSAVKLPSAGDDTRLSYGICNTKMVEPMILHCQCEYMLSSICNNVSIFAISAFWLICVQRGRRLDCRGNAAGKRDGRESDDCTRTVQPINTARYWFHVRLSTESHGDRRTATQPST